MDPVLARAINQCLAKHGFNEIASSFQEECENRKINLKTGGSKMAKSSEIGSQEKKLMAAFEKGEKSKFFQIFYEIFGPNSKLELSTAVLEFECQVYFATTALRKSPPDKAEFKKAAEELKVWLEEGPGANMAENAELLPFFALPYVLEPMKHPVFRELLSKKYTKQLQSRLLHQLKKLEKAESSSESDEDLQLLSWKHAYDSRKLLSTVDRARIKDYQELQHDYYKIIDIAGELIECLEQTCRGKTISPDLFSNIANKLVESNQEAERRMQRSAMAAHKRTPPTMPLSKRNRSLNRRIPEPIHRRRPEPIKKAESTGNLIPVDPKAPSPPQPRVQPNPKINSPFREFCVQLNFPKISNQLVKNPGSRSSALLLQALRLQITKKPNLADALPFLETIAQKDVLLLKNKKNSVVATVVTQTESETKEEMARLLNAVSSFKIGRDYLLALAQGKELLYQLALALRTKKLAGFAADHVLAALEKLSVRSTVQKELILSGMIEWLFGFFDHSIGNFAAEYGAALLANLCLHSVAQSTIFRYKDRLLELLKKFLGHPNPQLAFLAANTLFVVFSFAKMRSAAKEADFEAILAEKLKTIDSPDLEAQICVVLRVLQGEIDVGRRKESDDDDEEDYIEAEIDSTDTLIPAMTELFGETLLQKKYMLAGQQPTIANEDAAPPGTVPRKLLPSVTGSKNVKYLLRKGVPPPLTNRRGYRDFGLPKEPIPAAPFTPPDQRLSSVASFATFVAENDKRKPLLALNGFNTAVTQWRHHQKKSAKKDLTSPEANSPAQRSPKKVPEPLKLSEVPKYRHRRKSESSVDEEAVNQHHPPLKATSSATLTELKKSADVAPVVGRINSRVPEDANVNEYAAVFGSRPKIARTPENTSGKQKNTVFMF